MKRSSYHLVIDGRHVATKFAWNAALKAMRGTVRGLLHPGETAESQTLSIVKADPWTHRSGRFRWSTSEGRSFEAIIRLAS